jgi:hypothetical protein
MRANVGLTIDQVIERPEVEVRTVAGFKAVYAKQAISRDSMIFYLQGNITSRPTKYTIQLGIKQHLNLPASRKPGDHPDYCWRYLNHCCDPNGYMNTSERTFHALRDIAAGEQITFNYLTTESEMAVPFNCTCGSPNCFGFIQGRNFLTSEQSYRLALIMGEENVVTLFLPPVKKFATLQRGQRG